MDMGALGRRASARPPHYWHSLTARLRQKSKPPGPPKPSAVWEEFSALLKTAGLLGAFVTVIYFLRIGYVPVDSVSGVASLGALVALLGAMLTLLTATFWLPLTLMWFGATANAERDLVRSTFGARAPRADVHVGRIFEFNLWTIGAPWLMVISLMLPADYLLYGMSKWLALLFALPLVYVLTCGCPARADHRTEWRLLTLAQAGAACIAPLAVAAGSLYWSWNSTRQYQSIVLVLLGLLPIAINTYSLFVLSKGGARTIAPLWIAFAATVAGGFVVSFVLADAAQALNGLMRTLSVRHEQRTLVLKLDACEEARLLRLSVVEVTSGTSRDAACVVTGATVLSTLGERWRLTTASSPGETHQASQERERQAVSIRSADVVAVRSGPSPAPQNQP
jgi:hypothetical protein